MTRFIPLIIRNALRNKRRTILTILSIIVSLFLFVILGVAHQSDGSAMYYVSQKDFATPLGAAKTERGIARRLMEASGIEPALAELAHRTEHSVEFQAVLLTALMKRYTRDFEIVPVLCGPVEALMATDDNPLSVQIRAGRALSRLPWSPAPGLIGESSGPVHLPFSR